jgi:hypothetical protein
VAVPKVGKVTNTNTRTTKLISNGRDVLQRLYLGPSYAGHCVCQKVRAVSNRYPLTEVFFNTVGLGETKRNQSMASVTFRESILLVVK